MWRSYWQHARLSSLLAVLGFHLTMAGQCWGEEFVRCRGRSRFLSALCCVGKVVRRGRVRGPLFAGE